MYNILIVDASYEKLRRAETSLSDLGFCHTAASPSAAYKRLADEDFDVVVTDIIFPEEAADFSPIEKLISKSANANVLVWTSYATEFYVENLTSRGAYGVICDKEPISALKDQVARCIEEKIADTARKKAIFNAFIGESKLIMNVKNKILQYADTEEPVLIYGESGTGKELAAHMLHMCSRRSQKTFLSINMGAIPETLAESEFFGTEKGAYTDAQKRRGHFESASGGTLFMDEISCASIFLQAKLLRVIEQKSVTPLGQTSPVPADVRLICASNADVKDMTKRGEFRMDFYYRICVLSLEIPPLRDRLGDIPSLLQFFSNGANPHITSGALKKLAAHAWPGNIRELKNCFSRARACAGGRIITQEDITFI